MTEQTQPVLPAEPWYESQVAVRLLVATVAQVASISLRIIGRFFEVSITSEEVDALFADINQGVAVVFVFLAFIKRGRSPVAPLTLTASKADVMNAANPPLLDADPTKPPKVSA